jgi:hypothetical protein
MGYPSVYPTGTTIYDPTKCWNGYTVFLAFERGAVLIDMNGNVVKLWDGVQGFPVKILPKGNIIGSSGRRNPEYGFMDQIDLVQLDWSGNAVWKFDKYELIEDPETAPTWMARQHHDFQREGNPVGYYVPEMEPYIDKGKTLVLAHKNLTNTEISHKPLLDDVIYEVSWDGEILWEWICSDHFSEMGFSEGAKNILCRKPHLVREGKDGDWMHMNSVSYLGPNNWYDSGDERFHPDNIIWSGRQTNIIAIIEKQEGKIVWQIGPEFTATQELRAIGQIIGPHHAHMIPAGLPGGGNILIFDNGGCAGYGLPNPSAPSGIHNAIRDHSRVIEINPVTLELVWKYGGGGVKLPAMMDEYKFYSPLISSAQRLQNGNTMITEGSNGRLFEITPEFEIVWEYVNPYFDREGRGNPVYRAYRAPYEWIPQLAEPEEKPISPINNQDFRVPGSALKAEQGVTKVEGVQEVFYETQACAVKQD